MSLLLPLSTDAERIAFFRALNPKSRRFLLSHATPKRLSRGESVWVEGAAPRSYVFVVSGRVKLTKSCAAGHTTTVEIGGVGEVLCATAIYSAKRHCCSAIAMDDDTTVLCVKWQDLFSGIAYDPMVGIHILTNVTCCGIRLCDRLETLSAGKAERRIASLLAKLRDRYGLPRKDGKSDVPFSLTRQEIADLCGTTIETATRVMSRFEHDGIIVTRDEGFAIISNERLDDLVASTGRR